VKQAFKFLALVLVAIGFAACSDRNTMTGIDDMQSQVFTGQSFVTTGTLAEDFEGGTKTSYSGANVTLGSGLWYFDDALIGNSTGDVKNGTKSARLRNFGAIAMQFDKAGAGTVTVRHARFGSDGNSSWQLWMSTNGGSNWQQVGSTVTTGSSSLQTATFTVNVSGNVRFQIYKSDGSSSRINIDDVSISDFTTPGGGGSTSASEHLVMGNPSAAVTNVNAPSNYLLVKSQFAISYNRDQGKANWVSWRLASNWIGSAPRQNDFRADNTLPSGWYQVTNSDYSGSGFDRGHYSPSADRTSTVADNSATFLMTNMMPQAPDNNQGPWEALESYCRTLVSQGNELYVIAGSYGVGGVGSNGRMTTIAGGRITVPNRTWKVIVVLPNASGNDAARVTASTRVIAIDMPNQNGIRNNSWGSYRTSVDAIERSTGYDILSTVSGSVQAVVEARVDNGATN
jgi:endonuclease G, mitochondrial